MTPNGQNILRQEVLWFLSCLYPMPITWADAHKVQHVHSLVSGPSHSESPETHRHRSYYDFYHVWLLLGTCELSSTKVRLSKQNPCSESDLHQSTNNAPTFLTFLMAHQYRFYNIPHILFIAFRMYPINITSSGVHHIVIPQRWKELTTQPSRIRIHITLE